MTEPTTQPGTTGPGIIAAEGTQELRLLNADHVCRLLQVKKSWLYDAVEGGDIPVIRLGKQLRFRPTDIAAYIEGLTR